MDIFEAAYRVAHDYHDAQAVGLAKKIGKNPGTFLNEINPSTETHKLGLADATLMQVVSGDHRILYAMAATLGEGCFPLGDLSRVSDDALLEIISRWMDEQGAFFREFNQSLADGQVTRAEYDAVCDRAHQVISAILELTNRLQGMVKHG